LAKYGCRAARSYFLVHEGRQYSSKAIAGAAHGYLTATSGPLRADEFSGGERTVARKLKQLGFEVAVTKSALIATPYEVGRTYSRREDIHGEFGGQSRAAFPLLRVLLSSYLLGRWESNTVTRMAGQMEFFYVGEGQRGDMEFVRGNKAIRLKGFVKLAERKRLLSGRMANPI
jgi:hypothetical protein